MREKTALVAGASGLVGHHLTKRLLEDPRYRQVTLLVRRRLPLEEAKLEQRVIDFDRLDREAEGVHAEDVFCCLGTTMKKAGGKEAFRRVDYGYPLSLARHARQPGTRQFLVITALGADPGSGIFYNRVKGELEEALKELDLPSLHLFRPSLLLGNREEFRFGESVAARMMPALSFALRGRLKKYRAIPGKTVARAMVEAARREEPGTHVYESDRIADMAKP
ncbi:uncharacterized protein YbjT (DUF2867 family) [Melghirimyces profundicolus]|uniref:Uncharacterized protein YbjT (DUF2867 family) n=1 Tax=Melghirimyces profundicolus TaxID=1242148 RepID=A0A2T6C933_9BACL|nr:oxidoreductase [Melghirimyces profundicolus]PTX64830.1 uncharacterized protein YbjT (DUF2867 family) [Melghirimyces profundicolus]